MNLLIFNLKTDANDSVLGFTTDWINVLAAHCKHVSVITMMAGKIAVDDNVTVYSVGKEKGYSEPRRLIEFYRLIWRVLHKENIDTCFAHMMPLFSVLGWPLLKVHNIPITLWYTHSHVSPLLRIATLLVNRVVSASPSGFRISTKKVSFIGHGIDVNRFLLREPHCITQNKLVLLTVGRISRVKRLDIQLKALALLPEHIRHNIEFHCVGDPLGDQGLLYANELRQLVHTFGLKDIVFFEPALPFHQVHKTYQSADIFINTSDTDSIDKTVLEAMSCGLPVITTNIAFKSVLGTELSREWLFQKNDVPALAKGLERLVLQSDEERRELGTLLRNIVVKEHSLASLADRILCFEGQRIY